MTEFNPSKGYKVATSNYMRRYFNGLKGKWDGRTRVQYLLPHYMKTPSPFSAAWRFAEWMVDYIETIYNGQQKKTHCILDFTGYNASTMVLLMKQLNPIGRVNTGGVEYTSQYYADIAADNGILTDTDPDFFKGIAKDYNINADEAMLNLLDNLPIAIVRAVKNDVRSSQNGRLVHLTIATRNRYGSGQKKALQRYMKTITHAVRDQIWAEAVNMYFDQQDDHYAIVNGYLVDTVSNPEILYN